MHEPLDDLAQEIAKDLVQQEKVDGVKAFDPATIFLIIQIIVFLFNLFRKKKLTPEQIIRSAQNPTLIQRVIIAYKVRKYIKNNFPDLMKTFVETKDQLVRSSLGKIGLMEPDKVQAVLSKTPNISDKYLTD